jgi:hypothetical protein
VGKKAAGESSTDRGRCSPTKALELLAPDFAPLAAAANITRAIHEDDHFPLYCDGEIVKPNIRAIAKVLPLEVGGRWTTDIVSIGPGLAWARGVYNWELEVDAVLALRPQPDTRVELAQMQARLEAAAAQVEAMKSAPVPRIEVQWPDKVKVQLVKQPAPPKFSEHEAN